MKFNSNIINVSHIILLGMPQAGKGTHSKFIIKMFDGKLQYVEMGEDIRRHIYNKTKLGKKIEKTVWAGDMLTDLWIEPIIGKYPLNVDSMLDGYPRTLAQAQNYVIGMDIITREQTYKINSVALLLKVDKKTALQRMKRRLANPNSEFARLDDTPEIMKHRIKVFEQKTMPAIEYLDKRGIPVLEIDTAAMDIFASEQNMNERKDCIFNFLQQNNVNVRKK